LRYFISSISRSTVTSFSSLPFVSLFFFLNPPATAEIYTLSLHDALPISHPGKDATHRTHLFLLASLLSSSGLSCLERIGSAAGTDRKSTRLNSSHVKISYAVFCLKKKR